MEENRMKNILRKANEFITRKAVAAKVAVSVFVNRKLGQKTIQF